MLSRVTKEAFEEVLGESFAATDDEGGVHLFTLQTVSNSGTKGFDGGRAPFSLLFRGPENMLIGQGIVPLQHPRFGDEPMPIFLVPVAKDDGSEERLVYEAVFS